MSMWSVGSPPEFSGSESVDEKIEALQDYLSMLLENLQYLFRHVGVE